MRNAEYCQSEMFFDLCSSALRARHQGHFPLIELQQLPSVCQKYPMISLSSAISGVGRWRHMSIDPPQNPSESPMANTVMGTTLRSWCLETEGIYHLDLIDPTE